MCGQDRRWISLSYTSTNVQEDPGLFESLAKNQSGGSEHPGKLSSSLLARQKETAVRKEKAVIFV